MAPFVGRQPELALLRARLTEALTGRPQTVQIQGPAGIGKTALLEHFLLDPGVEPSPVVLLASGEETEQLLAYGVIDQLVRSAGGQDRTSASPADPSAGPDAADPLTRHPADPLAGRVANPAAGRAADQVNDPVTVGAGFLSFLDGLDGRGVILAVDDAHWADRPSLQALIFALRRLVADRILAIIAVRDDQAPDLPESLGRLIRKQTGTELRLRGLDEEDLVELAAAMGIDGVSPVAARRLRYGTQGNPLHARALLEEFPPSRWGSDDDLLPPPLSFRRLVQDRYESCAEPTRRLVDAVAVLGSHCPLPVAAALAAVTDVFPAVQEATAADLLQASDTTSPWTLSFLHPLVRAAVYDALGPARRRVLHTEAAALLTDEAAVLHHRVAAAAEPDEELAADLSRFADAQARRQDWQSAAAHAVGASRLSPDPGSAQRRVLRAVIWTMLRGDAANAADYAADAGTYEPGPLRDVVLGSLAMAADDPVTAERLLTEAWRTSAPSADPEAAGIAALMTAIHWYGRLDAQATVRWCERALALIPPESSTYPIAQTYLVHGLGYAGRSGEAALAASPAQETPGAIGQLWVNPRSARGVLHLVEDDIDAARTDLESAAVTASRLGILNTAAFSFAYLARAEWLAGAWDEAMLHAERAVAINLESDFGFLQTAVFGIAVLVPAARGDWAAAEDYIRSMTEHHPPQHVGYERSVLALGMSRARVGEARGRPADVLDALDPVRRFPHRDAADEPGFWAWQDLYADALIGARRLAEAGDFLGPHEKLAEQRGRRSMVARLARARGHLDAVSGRVEAADEAFTRALRAIDGLNLPFEQARIELAAGRFLRRTGQRRRAADLLAAAEGRFLTLGAQPYADRCATELAASGLSAIRRAGHGRGGLTAQELVVARLAGGGLSNREIAAELVVSVKTVEYHLHNAFGKLGISSRRHLAERLAAVSGPGQ